MHTLTAYADANLHSGSTAIHKVAAPDTAPPTPVAAPLIAEETDVAIHAMAEQQSLKIGGSSRGVPPGGPAKEGGR